MIRVDNSQKLYSVIRAHLEGWEGSLDRRYVMIDRTSYDFVPLVGFRRMPELAGTDFAIQHKNAAHPVKELCMPAISAAFLSSDEAARLPLFDELFALLGNRLARFEALMFLKEQGTKHDST